MRTLFDDKGNASSMRLAFIAVVFTATLLIAVSGGALLILAGQGVEIDWRGYSIFVSAIGAFIVPAFAFKAWQKKYESGE